MASADFRTNGPNAYGSLYFGGGMNRASLRAWAGHFLDDTDFHNPYPEGGRAYLTFKHDERVIHKEPDYVFPPFRQFRNDVLRMAERDQTFRRKRKRAPFYVVIDVVG